MPFPVSGSPHTHLHTLRQLCQYLRQRRGGKRRFHDNKARVTDTIELLFSPAIGSFPCKPFTDVVSTT